MAARPKRFSMRGIALAAAITGAGLLTGCSETTAHPTAKPTDSQLTANVVEINFRACRVETVRATGMLLGDGLIATVAHSFDGIESYEVLGFDSKLVFLDLERDIAILQASSLDSPDSGPAGLELGEVADEGVVRLVTIAETGANPDIYDAEIIRVANVTLDGAGKRRAIELKADISSGDSGAPVLDDQGEVVGMVFATNRGAGSGWAIAASELAESVNSLTNPTEVLAPGC